MTANNETLAAQDSIFLDIMDQREFKVYRFTINTPQPWQVDILLHGGVLSLSTAAYLGQMKTNFCLPVHLEVREVRLNRAGLLVSLTSGGESLSLIGHHLLFRFNRTCLLYSPHRLCDSEWSNEIVMLPETVSFFAFTDVHPKLKNWEIMSSKTMISIYGKFKNQTNCLILNIGSSQKMITLLDIDGRVWETNGLIIVEWKGQPSHEFFIISGLYVNEASVLILGFMFDRMPQALIPGGLLIGSDSARFTGLSSLSPSSGPWSEIPFLDKVPLIKFDIIPTQIHWALEDTQERTPFVDAEHSTLKYVCSLSLKGLISPP